jgi:hypothetical protein
MGAGGRAGATEKIEKAEDGLGIGIWEGPGAAGAGETGYILYFSWKM